MRRLVDELRSAWQVSIRRACTALPFERSTYHYRSKRSDPTALKQRIQEIYETRVGYGYRRVHVHFILCYDLATAAIASTTVESGLALQ